MKEKNLPQTLWGETFSTASYVLNKCLTKKLKEIVPFEKWIGDKKNVIHLKVFGYVCYKHVPDAKRSKLDDRSRVVLLVGYHSTCAYKLYCPVTNKVEFNKDVIVKELEAWNQNKSQSNSGTVLTSELTSEDIFDCEGDFESEDVSQSEGDCDVEEEFEGESDSDPDSDNHLDIGGNHASEGGHDSEDSQTYDIIPASEEDFE